MIEAGIEFDRPIGEVALALASLGPPLRPQTFSVEERRTNPADRVDDRTRFEAFVARTRHGYFLRGPGVTYNLRPGPGWSTCDCYFELGPEAVERFLVEVSNVGPLFAFACTPEERKARNRVEARVGGGSVESWVGRDPRRSVPGLFWLTLLPTALLERHGVPIEALRAVAKAERVLPGHQTLFRFHAQPGEWQGSAEVTELCATSPGIFHVREAKQLLSEAKTLMDAMTLLQDPALRD